MDMIELLVPETRQMDGSVTFEVAATKAIECSYWGPGKIDVLNVAVPAGKHWRVSITVHIKETNA